MEKPVTFTINCGQKTCTDELGKYCKFYGTTKSNTISACLLFPSNEKSFTRLIDDHDVNSITYLMPLRCEECLKF